MNLFETIVAFIGLCYVILEYRASAWLWLFSFLMPLGYIVINFQAGLYANASLNVYYAAISIYGAVVWLRQLKASKVAERATGEANDTFRSFPAQKVPLLLAVTALVTVSLIALLHLLSESQYPVLDGVTAGLSVVGTWMLTQKYYQQWLFWFVVEPLTALMYALLGLWPSALLYIIYMVVSVFGYLRWKRLYAQSLSLSSPTTSNSVTTHVPL